MAIIIITLVGLSVTLFAGQPVVVVLAMLVLQMVHCLPQTRRLRGWWTLAAQAALFWWGEQNGFLAASVLLIIPGRIRWFLFGAVAIAAYFRPHEYQGNFYADMGVVTNTLILGVVIFGLTRLSDLRSELHAARGELAEQSVAAERDRISRGLDTVLGSALSSIIGLADKRRPEEIGTLSRDAAARVRQAPAGPSDKTPQADMTPRLAVPIMLSGLAIFALGGLIVVLKHPTRPTLIGYAIVLAVVGLQAYHSYLRAPGVRVRYAMWTLPVQTALAFVPLIHPEFALVNSLVSLAAASMLIVLPGRTAWVLFTAIIVAYPLAVMVWSFGFPLAVVSKPASVSDLVLSTIGIVTTAIMLYGLALLTRLVAEVGEARLALAAVAVAKEHRRVAADVHDLLGYGLSAITVKAELASRDPARADTELRDITRLARRTLADLRAIPYEDPEISLHAESASAREVLTATGIDVRLDIDTGLLADSVDVLLATVLREAVTNILRHGRAHRATIQVVSADGHVRLRVTNDGAPAGTARDAVDVYDGTSDLRHGGSGLINLTARVAATGGELTAGPTPDGGYELSLVHPVSFTP